MACAYVQPATVKAHAPMLSRFPTSGFGRRPKWTLARRKAVYQMKINNRNIKLTPAISAEQLAFALALANAAAGNRIPQSGMRAVSPRIILDRAELVLTDTAENRAIFAIKKAFGDNWHPVIWRLWALLEIMQDKRMGKYTLAHSDTETAIDDAIIAVAAEMPLNSKGLFSANAFFRRLAYRVESPAPTLNLSA